MRVLLSTVFSLSVVFGVTSVTADDTNNSATKTPPAKAAAAKAENAKADAAAFTAERETAALAFVRQHHPELAELLTQLKEMKPKEYKQAIAELFRTSERLVAAKDGNAQRYDLELEGWKLTSRIQVLTARATMSADPTLADELRKLLGAQADNRVARLKLDRDQTAERLKRLDANVQQAEDGRDKQIEKQLQTLLRTAEGRRKSEAAKKEPPVKVPPAKEKDNEKAPAADKKPAKPTTSAK